MPHIPEPLFPDDDGSADFAVLDALDADDQALIDALRGKRVFVAVIADARANDGSESESEMSLAVLAHGQQQALPVFTSIAELAKWRAQARPVPVLAEAAALQALTDNMAALIVDSAREISGPALRALVFDFPLLPVHQDPVVEEALAQAIAVHDQIVTAWMDRSDDVDAVITLLIPSIHSQDAGRIASAVASWMAADPQVRLRTSRGFDVQVVTAR